MLLRILYILIVPALLLTACDKEQNTCENIPLKVTILNDDDSVFYNENYTLRATCNIKEAKIHWTLPNKIELDDYGDPIQVKTGNDLVLKNIDYSQEGSYVCYASYGGCNSGYTQKYIKVNPKYSPCLPLINSMSSKVYGNINFALVGYNKTSGVLYANENTLSNGSGMHIQIGFSTPLEYTKGLYYMNSSYSSNKKTAGITTFVDSYLNEFVDYEYKSGVIEAFQIDGYLYVKVCDIVTINTNASPDIMDTISANLRFKL